MTALYLDGSEERVRVLLDGPALRMVQPGRADDRVPLRRVSRIVVAGRVDWSGQALNACFSAGLVIVFTGRSGQTLGFGLAARGEDAALARRIEACLDHPHFGARHESWLLAMERRAIVEVLERLGLPMRDLRPQAVRVRLITAYVQMRSPLAHDELERRLLALLDAWLVEELALRGVPAHCLVPPSAVGLDLRADLQRLLVWQLWPTVLRFGAYLARHGRKHRTVRALSASIARQFEAAVPHLRRVLADLSVRFERHLYGLWP